MLSDEEISESLKKLEDEFVDFNPVELATPQIEPIQLLFASELQSCKSVFVTIKLSTNN